MQHKLPVVSSCIITQTYAEHVARAKRMGCCYQPETNCKCWYYGGVDFAPPGSVSGDVTVWASYPGIVTLGDQGSIGYGKYVKTVSENVTVYYAHLERHLVANGQSVIAGTPIGIMGNTGNSTGRHLHWEVRINGLPVDPLPLLEINSPPVQDPELPVIPKLPVAKVRVNNLRIRSNPPSGTVLGYVNAGDWLTVIGATKIGSDIWLRIIAETNSPTLGWCAALYRGSQFIEVI